MFLFSSIHYSYVFPDQVFQKIKYYKQKVSKNNCIDNYFQEIYLPWMLTDDKMSVEQKYHGVHEFKPECRGECYTVPFEGTHPFVISNKVPTFQQKINSQLEQYI